MEKLSSWGNNVNDLKKFQDNFMALLHTENAFDKGAVKLSERNSLMGAFF